MDGDERLFDALVAALHRSREGDLDRPLTVAEIYQDLVPYRIARAELGFAMNADYEHALMRLLAGEGERLRLEPVEARDELRRELASRNPDVTLYRKYAACDVWVSDSAAGSRRGRPEDAEVTRPAVSGPAVPGQGSGAAEGADSDGSRAAAASNRERSALPASPAAPNVAASAATPAAAVSSGGPSTLAATRKRPAAEGTASAPAGESASRSAGSVACASCGSGLPADRPIRFCPWCGADRRPSCRACGEVLEPDWRFCTRCGSPAGRT